MTLRSRKIGLVCCLVAAGLGIVYFLVPFSSRNKSIRQVREAIARRDFQSALKQLDEHSAQWPEDPEGNYLLAQTARRAEQFSRAEKSLAKYRQGTHDRDRYTVERNLLNVQQGEQTSLMLALDLAERFPGDPGTLLVLEATARGLMRTGQWANSLRCLQRWLELSPPRADRVQALLWKAEARTKLGMIPEARADYREAFELNPESVEACLGLADSLISHDPQEALELLEPLARQYPNRVDVALGLARTSRNLGDLDRAHTVLSPLLRRFPEDTAILTEMARLKLDMRKPEEAEACARQAHMIAPNRFETLVTFLRCLEEQGKNAEATEVRATLRRVEKELVQRMEHFRSTGSMRKSD